MKTVISRTHTYFVTVREGHSDSRTTPEVLRIILQSGAMYLNLSRATATGEVDALVGLTRLSALTCRTRSPATWVPWRTTHGRLHAPRLLGHRLAAPHDDLPQTAPSPARATKTVHARKPAVQVCVEEYFEI